MKLIAILNNCLMTFAAAMAMTLVFMAMAEEPKAEPTLGDFIQEKVWEYEKLTPQQQALYEVWNLDSETIHEPIYLFGKDGGKI